MRTLSTILVATAFACSSEVRPGVCPGETIEVDGLCRATCSVPEDCLLSEDCVGGQCVAKKDQNQPEVIHFDVTPRTIAPGEAVFIDYAVLFADRITIEDVVDTTDTTAFVGRAEVKPTSSRSFKLTARRGSEVIESETISIVVGGQTDATLTAFNDRTTLRRGDTTLIRWNVPDGRNIRIARDSVTVLQTNDTSGSILQAPIDSATYELTADSDVPVRLTLPIEVLSPPRIERFDIAETFAQIGSNVSVTASWEISGTGPIDVQLQVDGQVTSGLPTEASNFVIVRPPHDAHHDVMLVAVSEHGTEMRRETLAVIDPTMGQGTNEAPVSLNDAVQLGAVRFGETDYYEVDVPDDGSLLLLLTGLDGADCAADVQVTVGTVGGSQTTDGPCPIFLADSGMFGGTYFVEVTAANDSGSDIDYLVLALAREPVCGDGSTTGAEQCDDTNLLERDGCNAQCQIEPEYVYDSTFSNGGGSPLRTGTPLTFRPATPTADPADEGFAIVELPFAFPFYGTEHPALVVHTNGWIGLLPGQFGSSELLTGAAPNGVIAPFAADLRLGPRSQIFADVENDRATVTFLEVRPTTGVVQGTATVVLLQTGEIRVDYGDVNFAEFEAGLQAVNGRTGVALCPGPCAAADAVGIRNSAWTLTPRR